MNPMSLSSGREQHWQRHGGLLRRENARREGENQRIHYEAGMPERLMEMALLIIRGRQAASGMVRSRTRPRPYPARQAGPRIRHRGARARMTGAPSRL